MSILPEKYLFIVGSCVQPARVGHFSDEERFNQTIQTLENIRQRVPGAIILFIDDSVRPMTQEQKTKISNRANYAIDISNNPILKQLSEHGQQSLAESVLLLNALHLLKTNQHFSRLMNEVKGIFKITGRSILDEKFDITEFDDKFGKFVFKKRIPTWMPGGEISHLLITRFYYICPSLIDKYMEILNENMKTISEGFDFEHAHFKNIPKEYLIEKDEMHCWGWISGNGQIEHY